MPDDSHPIFIPAWVAGDRRLSLPQKCLMGRIYILAKTTGWCWASNATLGKDLGYEAGNADMHERSVRRNLMVLEQRGHLRREGNGRNRKIRPMVPELQTLMGLSENPVTDDRVTDEPGHERPATRSRMAADKERETREEKPVDVENLWRTIDDFVAHRLEVNPDLLPPDVWAWIYDRGGIQGLRALSPKDYTWAIRSFRSAFTC